MNSLRRFIGMDYVIYPDESSTRADIEADVISSFVVKESMHTT